MSRFMAKTRVRFIVRHFMRHFSLEKAATALGLDAYNATRYAERWAKDSRLWRAIVAAARQQVHDLQAKAITGEATDKQVRMAVSILAHVLDCAGQTKVEADKPHPRQRETRNRARAERRDEQARQVTENTDESW